MTSYNSYNILGYNNKCEVTLQTGSVVTTAACLIVNVDLYSAFL